MESSRLPLFTCVIPVKGVRSYFTEALASLRAQGMGDDLEIIVQDGDVEPDGGQSDALNRGFDKARGEWLFWLNADDILMPGALRAVAEVIRKKPEAQWIVGNEVYIDAEGRGVSCAVGCGWRTALYRHAVPHVYGPSSFFRRELFKRVGGCDLSLKYCMDWDLWIKFAKAGARFERIHAYLWAQRRWDGSKTQRRLDQAEEARQWDEIHSMLKKNEFRVTRGGVWRFRLWRFLSGAILREAWDTLRMRIGNAGPFRLPTGRR